MSQPDSSGSSEMLHRQAREVMGRLLGAVEKASRRLARAAAGRSVFRSDHDLKATVELLKVLPHVLKHVAPRHSPPPNYGLPLIPRCPVCQAGPGAHWPEDCPQRQDP